MEYIIPFNVILYHVLDVTLVGIHYVQVNKKKYIKKIGRGREPPWNDSFAIYIY